MKKIISGLVMATLLFTPVGTSLFHDQPTTVEAKGYKSTKRSFNNDNSTTTNKSTQNNSTVNKTTTSPATKGFFSGGLMRGLMLGGLAGLLFGSLFANLGILASILGFIVNLLAIFVLFSVIRKMYNYFTKKNKKGDPSPWRG